ncbi:winged helix-turn-helix domain-containing protein [Pseudoalteromonas rubra]|uniref:winged helix-turn-helix domain-containing protein n=1 Tax=Pseudoalteromonas rubra TaxID=43658 RepID=UPI000F766BEB|nr:winged helix-turn-helix domain-containing protein [Pseudoalteromonas rubra]
MNEVRFSRQVQEVKFGEWSLDPRKQCISDGCVERELEPLLFRLLCYFIINNEQIITRQDLIDDVWGQKYVDDNAINRAMSELRKLLKSDKQRGVVIKTHYRKGYSFFLEPQIIYSQEEPVAVPKSSSKVPSSPQVTHKTGKKGAFAGIVACLLCAVVIGTYFISLTPAESQANDVLTKPVSERILSWVPGRYARLHLSPNNALTAFSFIARESSNYALAVKELDSGYERRLGESGVNYFPLGWSHDSQFLYYKTKSQQSCKVWQISADFNSGNRSLFDCSMSANMRVGGLDDERIIYSKSGYRNRDELSVLINRDLKTGEEFQISSPNLNSYGDQFLLYIPEKQVVLFERRQYDVNELYITDPDGGNQVKLLESPNRIWAANYDSETDSLLWLDNTDNTVFSYSFAQRKLVEQIKLDTAEEYASFQFLNKSKMQVVSYPFLAGIYLLNLEDNTVGSQLLMSKGSISPIMVESDYLIVILHEGQNAVAKLKQGGKQLLLDVPADKIKAIRYNASNDLLLVQSHAQISVYRLSDLSLVDTIVTGDAVLSAEFLGEDEIGYVLLGADKVKSNVYVYSLRSKSQKPLSALSALWIGRLDDTRLVALSTEDTLLIYDESAGQTLREIKLSTSVYRHSVAVGGGRIYHSDGERIFEIDPDNEVPVKESYQIDFSKSVIKSISYSEQSESLVMSVLEVTENQFLEVSIL